MHQSIVETTCKESKKARPGYNISITKVIFSVGLNTVELLKVASKNFGIGPSSAMHIAERLYVLHLILFSSCISCDRGRYLLFRYISGFISYPRTESTKYPGKLN